MVPPTYKDLAMDTPPVVHRDPVLPVLSLASVVMGIAMVLYMGYEGSYPFRYP